MTPFPDYVSGHSAFSGAAAVVLAMFYGSDGTTFRTGSDSVPDRPRAFQSFSEAAAEAAVSRLYGGTHFRFAIEDGLIGGTGIGEWTFANYLTETGNRSRITHPANSAVNLLRAKVDAASRTGAADGR